MTYVIAGVHRSSHIYQDGKICKMCTRALNHGITRLIVCPLQSLSRPRPIPNPTCVQSSNMTLCISSLMMLQIYNLHNHLRISKVPEYTARVGIIFTKFLKCLNKVRSLYLANQTVINMYAYTYILYIPCTSLERQSKQLLNVTRFLAYQYEVHLHWVL